jgi:hypothetical protein
MRQEKCGYRGCSRRPQGVELLDGERVSRRLLTSADPGSSPLELVVYFDFEYGLPFKRRLEKAEITATTVRPTAAATVHFASRPDVIVKARKISENLSNRRDFSPDVGAFG